MLVDLRSELEILVSRDMLDNGFNPHSAYSAEIYWNERLDEDDRDLQSGRLSVLQDGGAAAGAEED
jgi:hypothetical protein